MTNGQIDAAKAVFQKIFSQDFWFNIPEYQRSYVWQADNITELVDDLYYAYKNKPKNEYFLGSLVLKKLPTIDFAEYEVLDGQQRLTTFLLMMAVIRDLIHEEQYKSTIHETIYQEKNLLKQIPARMRITYKIRDNVQDFMQEYIIEKHGTQKIKKLEDLKKSNNISLANMSNAILILNELIKDKEDLEDFVGFIFNYAIFIYVSTDNTEDAFRMFTILNDRGIPLTNADILKSENIGALISEKEISKYAKLWEEIEGKQGEKFDRFLQFIRTILIKEKARSSLLEEFMEKIYNKENPLLTKGKDTFELVSNYSDIYQNIIDLEDSNLSNEFKNLLTIMQMGLRSEDWVPPLLHFYNKFKYDCLDEFLVKLEYKFSSDWICGITPTVRLDNMNVILKSIDNAKAPRDVLNNSRLFKVDKNDLRVNIEEEVYKKQFAKHMLLKLEYLMSDNTVHITDYKNISVEHVLPQNPEENSKWKRTFSEKQREFWTNKLANLVLIGQKKNSALGNLDFAEKKDKYLKSRMDVFKASKVFLGGKSEWTPQVLERRQKELVELLVGEE